MELEPRLRAELLVKALLRQCVAGGHAAYVLRRGDADSGAVLIKRVSPDHLCVVFQTVFADDGRRQWTATTGDAPQQEAEADAFIARQADYDEDLWVVEVEAPRTWMPQGL